MLVIFCITNRTVYKRYIPVTANDNNIHKNIVLKNIDSEYKDEMSKMIILIK